MPVRNAESHLTEALQTVLAQDWPNLELIAVDDGSRDRSPQILADAARAPAKAGRRMQILRQEGAASPPPAMPELRKPREISYCSPMPTTAAMRGS